MSRPQTVILVHGLWMTSLVMWPLGRRLGACGFRPVLFNYHSLRRSIDANARALIQTAGRQGDTRVHLVGHSLGGLVILQALQDAPDLIDGCIVLLGSPVNGSVVARRLHRRRLSRWLVGRGADGRLGYGGQGWQGHQPLGVIAGTRPAGIGQALGGLPRPHDGTVSVAETRLAGATDTLLVKTTHTGLIASRPVARAVCAFLAEGRFPDHA
ncbi:MAG: alpha/beta fold hydrolase [Thiohalobacterales bacterium]|nr:alpha/beta fold hydrolase [Thiohalobacterales bacterium]